MNTSVDIDNLNMLKELIGKDLKEILDAYISTAPNLVNQIEDALISQDVDNLRLHAHSLKGSSANIGANTLSSLSASLEQFAKEGQLGSPAVQAFSKSKDENSAVMDFLNTYIQQF